MCMFSRPVPWVASTSIFARTTAHQTQLLAYAMSFAAVGELAMILPLPVSHGAGEEAVRFIDFSRYPRFFDHLAEGFPQERMLHSRSRARSELPVAASSLVVHDVGDFEASFVPTVADFARLDERFQLPPMVWEQLPAYADYGFAVFKLRGSASAVATKQRVHPMALEFPTRAPRQTFFPTVHVHDGRIHSHARFDHALYLQRSRDTRGPQGWDESLGPALAFVEVAETQGLVLGDELCHRRQLRGSLPNADVWV